MVAKFSLLRTVFTKASIIQDPSVIGTSNLVRIFQTSQETRHKMVKGQGHLSFIPELRYEVFYC